MIDIEGVIALSIPIVAIGAGIVKSILNSLERQTEMRLRAQQGTNEATAQQIAALKQEVAALRDTSTQFDVSLEQSVQRLEERMGRMETRAASQAAPPSLGEEVQRLGGR